MTEAPRPGLFISFEGTEGSGKSTQMLLLVERLREEGFVVAENQEPGATQIGRQIRGIFLNPAHEEMAPMTELLLVFASRTQAAEQIIRPALGRGEIVVSDRFTDSTLAYQGEARGLGFEIVLAAHQLALGELLPDLTLCILVDVEQGLARARQRNISHAQGSEARLDRQDLDFHSKVRLGYERVASTWPNRVRLVNGLGSRQDVAERVWQEVSPLLPNFRR